MTADFSTDNLWMLPQAVDEILPPQARALEQLRRLLLDCYDSWGYELIIPPIIEYLDSLLLGQGSDLDVQTFKLTDQLNGRTMGVRADTTPQAARIDAHKLSDPGPSRLCYVGTVLHTRPEGPDRSRNPIQVGAELYGHSGPESDLEVIELLLETLRLCSIPTAHLDLGHVGLFRGLAAAAGLDPALEARVFSAMQRKAVPEIAGLLDGVAPAMRDHFLALVDLNGSTAVLAEAHERLHDCPAAVHAALDRLESTASQLQRRHPTLQLHVDLAELPGYQFHTGLVFAAFVPGRGREIARGGRYDGIGAPFGRARPATGFSADLKQLAAVSAEAQRHAANDAILAPWSDDPSLLAEIARLRQRGRRVILELPGVDVSDRVARLIRSGADWVIESR